jgi:hypothetical protein
LDYRVASIYLFTKNYPEAVFWFKQSESHLSLMQSYLPGNEFRRLIESGIALAQCEAAKSRPVAKKAAGDASGCHG